MPLVQVVDEKRSKNMYKGTMYRGNGFLHRTPKAYLQRQGGIIDLSSIVNFVKDNKDLLKSGVDTVGSMANMGKTIAETVKSGKELEVEKVKQLNQKNKKKTKKQEKMTPEQEEKLKEIMGNGFPVYSKN
jgi:hypothetical protein